MSSLIAFKEKYFRIYQKHFRSAENSCICQEITELYGFFFFFLGVCVCQGRVRLVVRKKFCTRGSWAWNSLSRSMTTALHCWRLNSGMDFGWSCTQPGVRLDYPCGSLRTCSILWSRDSINSSFAKWMHTSRALFQTILATVNISYMLRCRKMG